MSPFAIPSSSIAQTAKNAQNAYWAVTASPTVKNRPDAGLEVAAEEARKESDQLPRSYVALI
jgi:hypothetical protein